MATIDRDPDDQRIVDTLIQDQHSIITSIARHLEGSKVSTGDLAADVRLFDALTVVLKYYGGEPVSYPDFIPRAL